MMRAIVIASIFVFALFTAGCEARDRNARVLSTGAVDGG